MDLIAISDVISLIEKATIYLKNEIEHTFKGSDDIIRSLEKIQAYLQEVERTEDDQKTTKSLINEIRSIAHEIQDVFDEFIMHAPRHQLDNKMFQKVYMIGHNVKRWKPLHDIQSKMSKIRETIPDLVRRSEDQLKGKYKQHYEIENQLVNDIPEDDEMLLVDMETINNLVAELTKGQDRRRMICIVGAPGSGKTVLVDKVFRRSSNLFECCAWFDVPLDFLSSFSSSSSSTSIVDAHVQLQMGRYDERRIPLNYLKRELSGKSYILVVEDIRSEKHWQYIKRQLPDESNKSRIIVTSTNTVIMEAIKKPSDVTHQMKMSMDHALTLLRQKVFKLSNGEKLPDELIGIAQQIVIRCQYIPRDIAAAGRLLSKKSHLPSEWENVHRYLGLEISSTFLPSYKNLSNDLKRCLLYFSMFPEDSCIRRARLIRLWVAEGFVKGNSEKTLEDTAEDILNELVARNIVEVCSMDLIGRVKSCKVRSLVREFSVIKSEEQYFATIIRESDCTNFSIWDKKLRRLSLHYVGLHNIRNKANLEHVRTLCAFGSSILKVITMDDFKLLKVLDLQGTALNKFPEIISKVKLLRYLSVEDTEVTEVPTSIYELHYLEYLNLKNTQVTRIPGGVCTLQNLRHLLARRKTSGNSFVGVDIDGSIGSLHSLQKLTLIKANNRSFIIQLGELRELQKLRLIDLRQVDGKHLCQSLLKMEKLSILDLISIGEEYLDLEHEAQLCCNLQRLYLNGPLHRLPKWIGKSLSSVVRIQLKRSELKQSPLEVLQTLPNLIDLHMVEAFTGEVLIIEKSGFKKLRTLHIELFSNLDTIQVYSGAMPCLEMLTLVKCMKLTALPDNIPLEKLQNRDMPPEFIRDFREKQNITSRSITL